MLGKERLVGFATSQGTAAYAGLHPDLEYSALGTSGLHVSAAGFGGYRVDVSVEEHVSALEKALLSGINLLDTSANYADGGSERLIGKVLRTVTEAGHLTREQVVVVSKAGYLQGENYRISRERTAAGKPFPELVLFGDGLEHCIHPEFLSDQITRSLERLQLQSLDCCLLHNPEYYLKSAETKGMPREKAQTEYYRRIKQAFLHFESEVKAGRIGCYGVSSNTFPARAEDYSFTSLSRLWEIAEEISKKHSFQVVEFPLNLLETGAVLTANQPEGISLLEFAAAKHLGVLINRPLNAIIGERLVRLAEAHYTGEGVRQARAFRDKAAAIDADWVSAPNLSQLALRVLRSTYGVSSVLVGMRNCLYVADVLEELSRKCPVRPRTESWRKLEAL